MSRSSIRLQKADTAQEPPIMTDETAVLDLDELMGRLREEVRARKHRAAAEQASASLSGQPRRVFVDDLLDLPEAAFAYESYRLILGREAEADEADRQIDRLLLGRITRTALLGELIATEEARAAGTILVGIRRARALEGLRSSLAGRLFVNLASLCRKIYLLPKRIRQFVKRVEALEQRASEMSSRIIALERALQSPPPAVRLAEVEPQPAARPADTSANRRADALDRPSKRG